MSTTLKNNVSLLAAGKALLVRFVYAINGIILTFVVHRTLKEPRIFFLNLLLIPSAVEVIVTLKYKRRGEWTWFIPSVFIYLLWIVPSIIVLEMVALDFRAAVVSQIGQTICPIVFCEYDECQATTVVNQNGEQLYIIHGYNITDNAFHLNPDSHDRSRRLSSLFQQIMMLIIIFGRWLGPKGKLSRDQLSSLLLALTAMTVDMLEFSTDSLSIEAVACNKVYVGIIIFVWCWSLIQIPMGLTAVKQRKPRVIGRVESRDFIDDTANADVESDDDNVGRTFDWRSYIYCCCESEIWALMVSMCMQDGPYLALRLYIIFSAGYVGETLIFFAAKNALIVMLQSYRVYVKVCELWKKRCADEAARQENSDVGRRSNGSSNEQAASVVSHQGGSDARESDNVSGSDNDVEAQLLTGDDNRVNDFRQDEAFTVTEVKTALTIVDNESNGAASGLGICQSETEVNHHQTKKSEPSIADAENIKENHVGTDDESKETLVDGKENDNIIDGSPEIPELKDHHTNASESAVFVSVRPDQPNTSQFIEIGGACPDEADQSEILPTKYAEMLDQDDDKHH